MATYYALTTINAQTNGWAVVGIGATKDAAQTDAEDTLGPINAQDIYSVTQYRNLTVLSRSAAIRKGFLHRDAVPVWVEADEEGATGRYELTY